MTVPDLGVSDLEITFTDATGARLSVLTVPDFAIAGGTRLAVTGPSGSGKSSFLYAISGILRPVRGNVRWDNVDILSLGESARDRWRRRTVGLVFQDFHLIGELSPLDNVLVGAWFERWRAPDTLVERARMLLEQVAVPTSRRSVSELSRGESQRVAIARALLFDPPVVLADEPTASLDKAAGERVADLLVDIAARSGRTLVVVTHDTALLERFPDSISLVHGALTRSAMAAGARAS